MRYNLGYMDKYTMEAIGCSIENNPLFYLTLKRPVDPIKLEDATHKALERHPLFKTKLGFDHEYFYETNNAPLIIVDAAIEDRPKTFGKTTNGYPWRLSYHLNNICFEWSHSVSDGSGAIAFFRDIVMLYFGCELEKVHPNLIAPGYEPFFDKKEKGRDFEIDPPGFKIKKYHANNKTRTTESHAYVIDTEELIDFCHVCKSSITPVLALLYSKAIRNRLPEKMKNKNVACEIAYNVRVPLNYETMHNCIDMKRLTYIDEYEKMNFASVAEIYKRKLDIARRPENIVRSLTERLKLFKLYHLIPTRRLLHLTLKIYASLVRPTECNFTITYLGKISFPDEVDEQIEDFRLQLIPDFGECVISAIDYKGHFNMNIHSNYLDKGINDEFIKLSKSLGLNWKDQGSTDLTQSSYIEK